MNKVYVFFLFATGLFAQSFGLLPVPKSQFLSNTGAPLAGGCVFTYASGTSTPQSTFTDSSGTAANTNPVMLDGGGRANIWLNTSLTYRIMLTSAPLAGVCAPGNAGPTVWTVDGVQGGGGGGGTGTFLPLVGGTMTGSILVGTTNTIDLGSPSSAWRGLYLGTGLFMGSTTVVDSSANGTFHNVTVTGTCTGCTPAGAFLPLAGGTMTGNILVTPTDTVNLGSNTAELSDVYVKNMHISNACSGAGCGGGGSFLPLSGGTMTGNIAASVGNSYFLGSAATPWGVVFAKTAVGTGSVHIYDSAASDLTGNFFHIQADFALGNASILDFIDTDNNPMLQLTRRFQGTNINSARFDMDVNPLTDNTRDLGGTFPAPGQAAWRDIYYKGRLIQNGATIIDASQNATVNNLTITGTCSGCPGSGGGSFLPITGGTMTGPIQFNTVGTLDIGTPSHPGGAIYGKTTVGTPSLHVYDPAAADLTGNFFKVLADFSSGNASILRFEDTSNNPMLQLTRRFAGVNIDAARFDMDLEPLTDNTRDIGGVFPATGQGAWRNIYFKGNLFQANVSTSLPIIDTAGNARFANLTVTGACTGCGGGGGAVSSVTGSGAIQASPTTGAVVVSCPNCGLLPNANNWTGFNTFINATTFNGTVQFGPGSAANLNTSGGATFQNTVTVASGGLTVSTGTLTANAGEFINGNLLVSGSGAVVAAGVISTSLNFAAAGHAGITGSTCSHWTGGICDQP